MIPILCLYNVVQQEATIYQCGTSLGGEISNNILTITGSGDRFDYEQSKEKKEGDRYRLMEIKYICSETINKFKDISDEAWIFVGDYNSLSPVDNYHYRLDDEDSEFLVHDYLRTEVALYDLISEFYPGVFYKTYVNGTRIDYIYASKWVLDHMIDVRVISDEYTTPKKHNVLYTPSDHYPIFLNRI